LTKKWNFLNNISVPEFKINQNRNLINYNLLSKILFI
jgi:hypothetical protein